MILIKDGRVIDPKRGIDDVLDLVIEGRKIKKIGKYQRSEEYERIIEARGLTVAPGLMDVHVHFRDPGLTYKEDIHTGAAAAAAGGFTTVVCMANTKPCVDNEETLRYVLEEGRKTPVHVLSCGTVTVGMEGKELTDMDGLRAAGAAGFTDDGKPLQDERLVQAAMEKAAALGVPLSFHEEDPSFIAQSGVNAGEAARALGLEGATALAEEIMVARDCMLALHTGARVNIQHVSSGNSVRLIRLAKDMGADVWAEVTPHHFSLDERAVQRFGTCAKINPPLRTKEDRYALIEGLKDGTIDLIATDHAPHSREEKELPFPQAPSGIIGLETALALGITNLVRKGHLTIMQLMEKMSLNPARLYGLEAGSIEEGKEADLVIFDEGEQWKVEGFASKASNSPFLGESLYGRVKYTVCGGQIAYEDGKGQDGGENPGRNHEAV